MKVGTLTHLRPVAVALVVLGLVGAGGLVWWRTSTGLSLQYNGGGVEYVREVSPKRPEFTMSIDINHPGSEITVLEVKPRPSANVVYLGAFTVWPRDHKHGNFLSSRHFPPRAPFDPDVLRPIDEPVPASETAYIPSEPGFTRPTPVSVLPGFRITSGDVAAVNGVEIIYTVDGKKIREFFWHTAIVCVDADPCAPEDDSRWTDRVLEQLGLPDEF